MKSTASHFDDDLCMSDDEAIAVSESRGEKEKKKEEGNFRLASVFGIDPRDRVEDELGAAARELGALELARERVEFGGRVEQVREAFHLCHRSWLRVSDTTARERRCGTHCSGESVCERERGQKKGEEERRVGSPRPDSLARARRVTRSPQSDSLSSLTASLSPGSRPVRKHRSYAKTSSIANMVGQKVSNSFTTCSCLPSQS